MNEQQRIVCAANRLEAPLRGNTKYVLGVRHYDEHMHEAIKEFKRYFHVGLEVQGFIDNRGKFLTRTEAWKVAESAGQILYRVGGDDANGGTLYSENLY